MHWIDWSIIAFYIVFVTLVGLLFVRRASGSVAEFFVAGRNLPWWLAGTSLVATSFAADTPLFVAGLIATQGIAGNWLWWNQVMAWALAMVFFSKLWRRSGVITDAEFVELRYGGRVGAFLRGFKAIYTSVIFSTGTVAFVMLAMQKIIAATMQRPTWVDHVQGSIEGTFGLTPGSVDAWKWIVLVGLFLVATLYTALSGFWGIVVTDLLQFVIAMGGSILFAVYAVDSVGGIDGLRTRLLTEFGAERVESIFRFFPERHSPWMPLSTFAIYLSILWWGDCGGFAAQRMFSTKTERDSVLASVWYSIAHFALRPWPWVLVGLVAMVYYPQLADPESGYPKLLMEILPTGIKGLLIASLLAAFMSTVDTHLNWNASYFTNDIYKRFVAPDASEARCVWVSRISVLVFAAMAISVAYFLESIKSAVVILFNLQAGIGLVLILRWFWWRVNAWSEISAMVASVVITTALPLISNRYDLNWSAATRILLTVMLVTPIWITATMVTAPVEVAKLEEFYRRVRPNRSLWGPIATSCKEVTDSGSIAQTILCWLLAAGGLYGLMCAIGKAILGAYLEGLLAAAIGALALVGLRIAYRQSGSVAEKVDVSDSH